VVASVLRTAAAELGRGGYETLRVDDVAEKAGVNKTTIYRRWPTKAALVAAVMRYLYDSLGELPDTGDLRADLVGALVQKTLGGDEQRSAALIALMQIDEPDVAKMARVLRRESRARWLKVFERAIARGEIRADVNVPLLVEILTATVWGRFKRNEEPVTAAFCAEVVDVLLASARPQPAAPATTSAAHPRRPRS
jgi:AcrR family transcriptional regulator